MIAVIPAIGILLPGRYLFCLEIDLSITIGIFLKDIGEIPDLFAYPYGEANEKIIPQNKILCEPQLGKRDLYPNLSTKYKHTFSQKLLNFLQFADGTNNLVDISNYINCSLAETRSILKILLKQKLVAFTK